MVDDGKKKDKAQKAGKMTATTMSTSAKPEVSDLIGQRLRKFYDTVAEQPVPERFLELLNRLEAASAPKKPN